MCESRTVPSGKVYRQVFDAQVQLSRSLLAGRKDTRTNCLSAQDSTTHSTTSSREQQVGSDEDEHSVRRLPDTLVVECPSSDIIENLTEKRRKKHKKALEQLDRELTELTEVCESRVRTISQELLTFMLEVDLRLESLKNRMVEKPDHGHVSPQDCHEWNGLWQQVEEEIKLKKIRIMDLGHKLTETETQRTNKIRAVLMKHCHLLEKNSFLLPQDIHRLIHTEATMVNQSLLSNRRSTARLLLLLQEENLWQESLLRLHWDDCLNCWKRSRVTEVIDRFRCLFSSDEDQQLVPDQQMSDNQQILSEQRQDLINKVCSLVPPTCSTDLVSDWFKKLTAINQQIDQFHANFLHQLRCRYEKKWQDRLADVEHCKVELSALQLPEEELNNINVQLLTLIGQSQRRVEDRLATLDVCSDSVARHTLRLSRCVFAVMQQAVLLWETHSHRLERREEEIQQDMDDIQQAQQQGLQTMKVQLENLLVGLRQESSEDSLKMSAEKTAIYMQDVKDSYRQCISDQCRVLDHLPDVLMEELLSYSSSLSAFFLLDHTYTPDGRELVGPLVKHRQTDESSVCADPTQPADHWLTETEPSLIDLCNISIYVTFTSSRGVTYNGPAFQYPAPDVQQETHLSVFPVELLTYTLSRKKGVVSRPLSILGSDVETVEDYRFLGVCTLVAQPVELEMENKWTRTLYMDHLEQHFHDTLNSAVAIVTERKEAVSSERELQLQQLESQHFQKHIYQPRLAELQLHRQLVDMHCQELLNVLTSCKVQWQELQTSISRKNQEFIVTLSNMKDDVKVARSSQRLEVLSFTLQDCMDQHIKHTQYCQTTFRQTMKSRLQDARNTTTQLLSSFRLFSEGGDFAPQEVTIFQRRLKDKAKDIRVTEESICSELEAFESKILQQVKEASDCLEEKLAFLKSELKFVEKVQKIINTSQVNIKAEAASSDQQQLVISSRLEELRNMAQNTQVSPHQVLSFLSSVVDELQMRCQYLDLKMESLIPSAHPRSRKEVRSVPTPGLLQPSRTGADLLEDPVVGFIKFLNRDYRIQDSPADGAETEDRGQKGHSSIQWPFHTTTDALSALSLRRGCRSMRADRRFHSSGPKAEKNVHSYVSTVNSVLWKATDALLLVAQEFYRSERMSRFQLVPDTLDQWAENTQQKLLRHQEQALKFISSSREELVAQLSVLDKLMHSLPSVLIRNHERQQGLALTEEVTRVRRALEEMLAASEEQKAVNVRQLRASLREDELQTLNSREELRQQQIHSAVCCSHLDLQECVRVRGQEFVTSLASLTEKVLCHLDTLVAPAETDATSTQEPSEENTVTMETPSKPGTKPCTGNRTWSGIMLLFPPTSSTSDSEPRSSVATASITTARCTMVHQDVIEKRDAAVKRFEQLIRSEFTRSDDDKRRRLSELLGWKTHWRQQLHTLKKTTQH